MLHLLGYDAAAVAPKTVGTIQSLNVWDPPDFNLLFFWQVFPINHYLTS